MRVFIAISPPEETKSKISKLINSLKSKFPLIKWEAPEKIHLTLAFLGVMSEEKVDDLKNVLKNSTQNFESFELEITALSYFYKKHEDSIIYLDVVDRSGELKTFYRQLRRLLLEHDIFLPERLTPHISIGRLKRKRHIHEIKKILVDIARAQIPPIGSFHVGSINLYRSLFSKADNSSNYQLLQSSHFSNSDENREQKTDTDREV